MSELAELLEGLPVPDHGPDFWQCLEAELQTAQLPDREPVKQKDHGRFSRRRMLLVATAVLVILAGAYTIYALTTGDSDDSGTVFVDSPPAPTTEEEDGPDDPEAGIGDETDEGANEDRPEDNTRESGNPESSQQPGGPILYELDSSVDRGDGPISVEGDGVPLEFVPVVAPPGDDSWLQSGGSAITGDGGINQSFRGELYAVVALEDEDADGKTIAYRGSDGNDYQIIPSDAQSGQLNFYRTFDGLTWEPVAGLNSLDLPKADSFVTSGELIVNAVLESTTAHFGRDIRCDSDDSIIHIHTSSDGATWSSNRIEDFVPPPWRDACVTINGPMVSNGPTGMLLMVEMRLSFEDQALTAQALLDDPTGEAVPNVADLQQRVNQPGAPPTSEDNVGTLAWWSGDGTDWTPVAIPEPIIGNIGTGFQPVAGPDGFYLTPDQAGNRTIWRTTDGSSWEMLVGPTPVVGQPVEDQILGVTKWRDEIVTIPRFKRLDGTGPVIPTEMFDTAGEYLLLEAGEFGGIATSQSVFPVGEDPRLLAFTNGETWVRWIPPEPLGEYEVLGVGRDFVVLAEHRSIDRQRLWIGRIPP